MIKINAKIIGILIFLVLLVAVIIILIVGRLKTDDMKDIAEEAPAEETAQEGIRPPILDVAGEDIPGVPRYPGSVRISQTRADDGERTLTTSQYIASVGFDEIFRFYKEELPANGWINITEMQAEDLFLLHGYKEGAEAQISISSDPHYLGHTLIVLIYGR